MSKKNHPICDKHTFWKSMHRLYTREKSKFIPIGWICNECFKTIFDYEIKKYVEENKEIFEKDNEFRWYNKIKFNDIIVYNPLAYLES
ncbi:MAG: hypothetical protein ACFFG0_30275 [Candidatus Thorarchaeota archaeon]